MSVHFLRVERTVNLTYATANRINQTINAKRKVDLPEIKGNHRKFRNLVTSYIGKIIVCVLSLSCFQSFFLTTFFFANYRSEKLIFLRFVRKIHRNVLRFLSVPLRTFVGLRSAFLTVSQRNTTEQDGRTYKYSFTINYTPFIINKHYIYECVYTYIF